jgi:hypothetical protein
MGMGQGAQGNERLQKCILFQRFMGNLNKLMRKYILSGEKVLIGLTWPQKPALLQAFVLNRLIYGEKNALLHL